MKNIELLWKQFNVNLEEAQEAIQNLANGKCIGVSANSKLEIHLQDDVTETELESIQAYWDALVEESEEAVSYQSREQIQTAAAEAKAAALASATSKLAALGLSPEEIAALKG